MGYYTRFYLKFNGGGGECAGLLETFFSPTQFLIAPSNPDRFYIVDQDAIHRSDDGGASWTTLAKPEYLYTLLVAPSVEDRLYGLSLNFVGVDEPVLYRSENGGEDWATPGDGSLSNIWNAAVSPTDPELILAHATIDLSNHLVRSVDGGKNWTSLIPNFSAPSIAFDPQEPERVYAAGWGRFLRSVDRGETWQVPDSNFLLRNVIASPFASGSILALGDPQGWQMDASVDTWQASSWMVPEGAALLLRSEQDGSLIYAWDYSSLWRYVKRGDLHLTHLPIISGKSAQGSFNPAAQAIERVNLYRSLVGISPQVSHPAIAAAAQNHADYHMLNHADPAAWENGPHGEVEGKPAFTGKWPFDRMKNAGYPEYPYWGGAEVMHYIGDPVVAVDGWLSTIYHRVIPLGPYERYAGYGNGKNSETAVDVMDFGSGPSSRGVWLPAKPYPQAYPVDGQVDVPTFWWGGETPDPLPPGASRPVGYPFTLQGVHGALVVDSLELREDGGDLVPIHPNPPDCPAFNCFAVIAVEPLAPNTTYTVSASGSVDEVPFAGTWMFTTGDDLQFDGLDPNEIAPGPPWPGPR
jgi:hypothetical protein